MVVPGLLGLSSMFFDVRKVAPVVAGCDEDIPTGSVSNSIIKAILTAVRNRSTMVGLSYRTSNPIINCIVPNPHVNEIE